MKYFRVKSKKEKMSEVKSGVRGRPRKEKSEKERGVRGRPRKELKEERSYVGDELIERLIKEAREKFEKN